MLIAGFPAGPWGTNCYVAATGPGTECVVIDPGKDAAEGVAQVVREHKLKPVAVLVTHGHVDHMWCVAPVAGTYDATAWIHPDDRHLLANPMAGMSAETTAMLLGGKYEFAEPDRVEELADAQTLELAGLSFVVDHTPGHTEGSVTFRTPYAEQDVSEVMFSGDLLFAGSIGRTDLPGGDHPTMLRSLRDKVLTLPDDIVVLPGHGEQTSIARERATNPFLLDLMRRAPAEPRHARPLTMARPTPLSGFPELLPAQRHVEQQVLARLAETFELHGFASVETRAVEPLDQLLTQGRDLQGGLRPAPSPGRGWRQPGSACTSTSPCRSRATCSRTPASWSSRSVATRSRRCGAASGRRRAGSASSPRPTST